MNRNHRIIFVTAYVMISAFIISLPLLSQGQTEQQQNKKEVVATIDGEEVYMRELEQTANIQQIMIQLQQQHPQFVQFLYTSPEGQKLLDAYKRSQLNDLISRKLLKREAEREEIVLTQKDKENYFNEQVEMIKQQQNMSDKELLNALKKQGIESLEKFKEFFIQQQKDNLIVQKLVEEIVLKKIKVTDKEAKEVYKQREYQMEFNEVKDQIKRYLAQQKYIDRLKDEANIQIHLES